MRRAIRGLAIVLHRTGVAMFPRSFRRRFGPEMNTAFRDALADGERRRGTLGLGSAAIRALGALPVNAIRARWDSRGDPAAGGFDVLRQDVRFALRSLRRNPLTAGLSVGTFGLGIAACTAMFSIVDAVLLRPLPYPEPDRIVNVYPTNPQWAGTPGYDPARGSFSYPELEDVWREGGEVLEGLAMTYTSAATLRSPDGPPERVTLGTTTSDLLGVVLRTRPILGRLFTHDDAIQSPDVAVLGEEYWRTRFGSDPGVIGRTIDVSNREIEIIGVVPAGTRLSGTVPDAWVLMTPWQNRGDHRTSAVGRLRAGVAPERAAADLGRIMLANAPPDHARHEATVLPRQSEIVRAVRGPVLMLAAGAFLLLLIASANVAAVLVGRMLDREGELVMRRALGASRWRVTRQIITESAVLGSCGAVVGIVASGFALRGLELIAPRGVPRLDEATLNPLVLLFAILIAILAGIAAGVFPGFAVQSSERQADIARSRRMSAGRARLQGTVVVTEIAMATVLLVGGGLLARTVTALGNADAGFAIRELVSFEVSLPAEPTIEPGPGEEAPAQPDRHLDIAREIEALPGVEGVALTSVLPLSGYRGNNGLAPEGYDFEARGEIIAERRFVSADFFDVAGIRMVEGHAFLPDDDRADAPARMVISESLARHIWPAESAIGKRIVYWGNRETTVVGVAEDQRDQELREATQWAFYVPRTQAGQGGGSFLVRTRSPDTILPAIRSRVLAARAGAALVSLQRMSDLVEGQIAEERYRARLAILFAALATVFSILGIYGVTARAVASRTRELGIRKALGAQDRLIVRQVLGRAARLAAIGGVAGFGLAWVVTRWLEGLLWGVERTDPLTLGVVAGTLAAGAALAAWGPGLRVRKLNPVDALRSE